MISDSRWRLRLRVEERKRKAPSSLGPASASMEKKIKGKSCRPWVPPLTAPPPSRCSPPSTAIAPGSTPGEK
uniref:Uncharacterized protein n=1 Tax=Leersia perrieri TaxID=77586 RepID=A0A0D9XCS4_9ORYZ